MLLRRRRPSAVLLAAALLALSGCAASTSDDTPSEAIASDTGSPRTQADTAGTGTASVTRIVTLGDSIMAGYGLDEDEAWPALLSAQSDAAVTNLACNGAGFVAEGDCDVPFAGLINAAVAADPAIIIVQSSDNDYDESADEIALATMDTILALHQSLPDARIVGLSTLWNQPYDAPDQIEASTNALRDAVETVGGTFIDIGQPLQGDDADLLQFDDEHPTAEGQRVLLGVILAALADAGVDV